MSTSRRSLILTAAFGMAVPSLVKAKSLVDIPGDPLTARGLLAASKWAEDEFMTHPSCRLVYADGQTTRWMEYQCLGRSAVGEPAGSAKRTYAVAMEVSAVDANGKRFVTSVPVDGVASERLDAKRAEEMAQRQRAWAEQWERPIGRLSLTEGGYDGEIPF